MSLVINDECDQVEFLETSVMEDGRFTMKAKGICPKLLSHVHCLADYSKFNLANNPTDQSRNDFKQIVSSISKSSIQIKRTRPTKRPEEDMWVHMAGDTSEEESVQDLMDYSLSMSGYSTTLSVLPVLS